MPDTATEPTTRTVRVIRYRYTIEDDGAGGSVAVETTTDISEEPANGYALHAGTGSFHESPAREAVGIIRRENLGTLDGAEWFGWPESSVIDYATGEEEEKTAHLAGPWTDTERRAIARMVAWLEARDAATVAAYLARTH